MKEKSQKVNNGGTRGFLCLQHASQSRRREGIDGIEYLLLSMNIIPRVG